MPAPSAVDRPQVFAAEGPRRARVALLSGCAQQVLAPAINEATIRLLTRHGVEVVVAKGAGCCGALVHHMGREAQALAAARANIDAWERERERGLDAVIINASGCGTTVKDYGFMLREDPAYAEKAARIAALAKDVTEFLAGLDLRANGAARDLVVAYHSACSMQHGQKITESAQGSPEGGGVHGQGHPGRPYLLRLGRDLQPAPARAREAAARTQARATSRASAPTWSRPATSAAWSSSRTAGRAPVVHTVELLDWATGGARPPALAGLV